MRKHKFLSREQGKLSSSNTSLKSQQFKMDEIRIEKIKSEIVEIEKLLLKSWRREVN